MRPVFLGTVGAAAALLVVWLVLGWSLQLTGSDDAGMTAIQRSAPSYRRWAGAWLPQLNADRQRWLFAAQGALGGGLFALALVKRRSGGS